MKKEEPEVGLLFVMIVSFTLGNILFKAFRETKNYKCENCSYKLPDMQFSKFIQTHHINSFDKLNNKRSNLKCLCVKCHSTVDDYHRKQFTSIEKQLVLAEFEEYKTRP